MTLITDAPPTLRTFHTVLNVLLVSDWASPEQLAAEITEALNGRKVGQPATSSRSVGPHESFANEALRPGLRFSSPRGL